MDYLLLGLKEQEQKIEELEQEKCRITHIGAMLVKELQAVKGDGGIMKDTKSIVETMKEMGYVMVVRCEDCEYSYEEGFEHPHLICEKHPELGSVAYDWFCADGWKA